MHCVFSAASNDNANDNDDHIIFIIRDKNLYLPVINKRQQKFVKTSYKRI